MLPPEFGENPPHSTGAKTPSSDNGGKAVEVYCAFKKAVRFKAQGLPSAPSARRFTPAIFSLCGKAAHTPPCQRCLLIQWYYTVLKLLCQAALQAVFERKYSLFSAFSKYFLSNAKKNEKKLDFIKGFCYNI